jgi:hypothetical protein
MPGSNWQVWKPLLHASDRHRDRAIRRAVEHVGLVPRVVSSVQRGLQGDLPSSKGDGQQNGPCV